MKLYTFRAVGCSLLSLMNLNRNEDCAEAELLLGSSTLTLSTLELWLSVLRLVYKEIFLVLKLSHPLETNKRYSTLCQSNVHSFVVLPCIIL